MAFHTDERCEFEGRRGGEEVDRGGAQEREEQRGGARPPRRPHGRALTQ